MGSQNKRRECEVRMQSTESFPNKSKMIEMSHLPSPLSLYHHLNINNNNNHKNKKKTSTITTTTVPNNNNNNNYSSISSLYCETMSGSSSSSNSTAVVDGVGPVGVGGGSLYCNLSSSNNNNNNNNNKVDYWNDLYDVVGAASSVQRTFLPLTNTSHSSPKSSGRGEMGDNKGGGFFTVRQWEELERQIMICKYMMASIPVPPHLLLTLSNTITPPYSTSQSKHNNTTSCKLDVRYTRGGGTNNDAEPWRCRRTDGKKWRCSRDVVPYQKYCERHAHKPRPRSRKPVEPQQCQISTNTNASINSINNHHHHHDSTRHVFNIPAMTSGATTYAQPRCTEWFMKGDPIPGSSLNEQWQQLVQPSPKEGLKLYDEHDRAVSLFQKHYGEELMHTDTYLHMNDESTFQNQLDSDHQAQTTRHFIDAWSCAEREVETGHISTQTPKLPLSSLTLSMSGGTEIDDNNDNAQLSFKTDWLDANPYTCSTPGGPLGEALCLGMSSTAKGQSSNLPSPHGYNSHSTATSTCSKSSCEDNAHGLHFR